MRDTIVPVSTIEQSNSLFWNCLWRGALIKFDKKSENFFLGKIVPSFWNWLSKTFRMAAGSFIFVYKTRFYRLRRISATVHVCWGRTGICAEPEKNETKIKSKIPDDH